MNNSLLKRDFILLRKQIPIYFLLCIAIQILLVGKAKVFGMIPPVVITSFFTFFYLLNLYECQGKNEGEILLLSMPYDRHEIVKSRYMESILVALFTMIISILIQVVIQGFHHASFSLVGIGILVLISSVLISVFTPVYLKYPYVKATNFFMMCILGAGAVFVIYAKFNNQWNLILDIVLNYSLGIDLLLIVIAACILFFSFRLSLKIYNNREF